MCKLLKYNNHDLKQSEEQNEEVVPKAGGGFFLCSAKCGCDSRTQSWLHASETGWPEKKLQGNQGKP